MRLISAAEIDAVLSFEILIPAIAEAFRGDVAVPLRHHHTIERSGGNATLLLMPAWRKIGRPLIGTKIVSVERPATTRQPRPKAR